MAHRSSHSSRDEPASLPAWRRTCTGVRVVP